MRILALIALYFACAAAHGAGCEELERRIEHRVSLLSAAQDDLGAIRGIGGESLQDVKECPGSARLWYLAARSAEVLEIPMSGRAFAESGGLKRIVGDAASHAPRSVEIVTVAARLDGSSAAARKAWALDPQYLPARWALMVALANEGSIREALSLCEQATANSTGQIARAKVLLSAGREPESAAEARKALMNKRDRNLIEPTPEIEIQRTANEVLGFALLKLGRLPESRNAFQAAAAAGSAAAKDQLAAWK